MNDESRPDSRPVLLFLYWPMVLIAVGAGAFVVYALFAFTLSGSMLPLFIVLFIGLLGLVALPFLAIATVRQFRGRGFRHFGRSARDTRWGDGL